MKYIDIHSHLYFPDYDADREAAIARAAAADIGIITVGTDLESSREAISLAETHENMWAIVGLHPVDAGEAESTALSASSSPSSAPIFNYDEFKKLALHPKVVAIGECGLDYFHMPKAANSAQIKTIADRQRAVFIEHIKLANEVKKPLMLHVRNAKNVNTSANAAAAANAYQEAVALLKEHAKVGANFHFFAGNAADLKNIIAAGCSVSFTGVITFTRDYDELVKMVPLERIMSETDAPFVSPASHRGQRNEPCYVAEIAQKIAEIRGENPDIVLPTLVNNAKKFFSI